MCAAFSVDGCPVAHRLSSNAVPSLPARPSHPGRPGTARWRPNDSKTVWISRVFILAWCDAFLLNQKTLLYTWNYHWWQGERGLQRDFRLHVKVLKWRWRTRTHGTTFRPFASHLLVAFRSGAWLGKAGRFWPFVIQCHNLEFFQWRGKESVYIYSSYWYIWIYCFHFFFNFYS